MSRSPTGHVFWMPASIVDDTWPVCCRRPCVVSERRVFLCRVASVLAFSRARRRELGLQ